MVMHCLVKTSVEGQEEMFTENTVCLLICSSRSDLHLAETRRPEILKC
jgi:hypothetical protein